MSLLSSIPILGRIIDKGLDVVDQFVEDKDQAAKLKAEIRRQVESQDHSENIARLNQETAWITGQLDINKQSARHKSMFVAGGRPAIIWICGTALGYQFVLYPLLCWLWKTLMALGYVPEGVEPPPSMSMSELMPLLFGLLGIGGMRSFDKSRGTQTDSIDKKEKNNGTNRIKNN